jgi:hypothetical protein
MKITTQTPTSMVIKAGGRTGLLTAGVTLLVVGLLVIVLVRVEPLTYLDAAAPDLIKASQERDPADSQLRTPSTGYASLNLAHYVGQLILSRERPLLLLSSIAILVGLVILTAPHRNRTVTLDKTGDQVRVTWPRWFFLTRAETYPLPHISEVRADWDRERSRRSDRKYRVELVIGHSEGAPLSHDYLFYKTVFPLTESYRYDRETAQGMVDEIRGFLGKQEGITRSII